jgi:3-oxoacyl-(acyl-carrier-protein) synthase
MPRIAGIAVVTPSGDLAATVADLAAAASAPGALPGTLDEILIGLARRALGPTKPDLVLLATTKADLDQWCESLLGHPDRYIGGPAQVAVRLRQKLGVPVYSVSAACASSPIACGVAARALASGRARRVLVLAGDRLGAFVRDGFAMLGALAADGCRPFDAQRTGLTLGETAAALVLEPDDAPGDGSYLAGWGASLDANHLTGPSRDGSGLARACMDALTRAEAGEPALIVGHGTGTRYNDDSESLAYAKACPGSPVVGYKGMLGHSLGACGLIELAIASDALRSRSAPGTVGFGTQGCAGAIRVLPPGLHALAAGPILCANAGFGGVNGAIVLDTSRPPARALRRSRLALGVHLDASGWRRIDRGGTGRKGRWSERSEDDLPRLTAQEVLGRVEPNWGRMDLACRALVALGHLSGPLAPETGIVLVTTRGCAATDRLFERARRDGVAEPQRFPYTLPTAPIGEVSIRLGLHGPGFALLGAEDAQGRAAARDLVADGCPAVLLARVEADGMLAAWSELWTEDPP